MPSEIEPPLATAQVDFLGAFESDFGFTLRERKSLTLDQLQINALEVEENFTSTGKSRAKQEPTENKRGKEKASSSGGDRESPNLKWDELDKLIRSLSHKVGKIELKNKNLFKQNAQINNQGYNPQYRRPPLQILPSERKEQLDHIPHPLYLEEDLDEQSLNTHERQRNFYFVFFEEEHENMAHQEANRDREAIAYEKDIDYYCKHLQISCKHNHNISMI